MVKTKKPKMRVPRAKPQIKHKSIKDYNRKIGDIELIKCSKCGQEVFMAITVNKQEFCMGCANEE